MFIIEVIALAFGIGIFAICGDRILKALEGKDRRRVTMIRGIRDRNTS